MKKYKISNLDCPNCALKIEKTLKGLKTVKEVSINFSTASMLLAATDLPTVIKTIKGIEPDVTITSEDEYREDTRGKKGLRRWLPVIVSGILFTAGLIAKSFSIPVWAEFLFFIPAYLLSGWKVLYKAGRNIIKGKIFDENFLMSLATIGALIIREPAEAVGVMLFYYVGETLQDISVNRSRRSIKSLLALKPEYAWLKNGQGSSKVDPKDVTIGSVILVKPGEKVPLDGEVLSGNSRVDTSALNGESVPKLLKSGDNILAGMINKSSLLEIKVTRSFQNSSVSRILNLVENALHKKAKTEKFITSFARYYTPAIVILAMLAAFTFPLFFPGMTPGESVYKALVLLVISCPCALVLSIPLGYFAGIGKASRLGILVKGSNYLDLLAKVKTVIFDKTGTLTLGEFKVQKIVTLNGHSSEDLEETAAITESQSSHPIAQSIIEHYRKRTGKDLPNVKFSSYEEVSGFGIKAEYDGKKILVGNDNFMHREKVPHTDCFSDGTVIHVVINNVHGGYLIISDTIKPGAFGLSKILKKMGVKQTIMLTGDNEGAAEHISQELELDKYYADLLPEDKIKKLEEIEKNPAAHKIAFVGDGINDSPIIARADIGIAMGKSGSDAAIDVADLVFLSDNPSKVASAIRIARGTKRIIWQNIFFAFSVKLIFITLGLSGLAGMWAAVFADIGVALLAVLNAIRGTKNMK